MKKNHQTIIILATTLMMAIPLLLLTLRVGHFILNTINSNKQLHNQCTLPYSHNILTSPIQTSHNRHFQSTIRRITQPATHQVLHLLMTPSATLPFPEPVTM